ncbi:secretion protein HlyD [Shinella sp. NM-101]|uniref:secretion protein HlyD n=1 Tax=Shinella sp. NM-101 TaxID=2744455 RepID=UPI001F23D519|nr:secretion protein HlyD [Shinella sp. NM-101]
MKRQTIILLIAFAAIGGASYAYWQGKQPVDRALVLSGNVDIREVNLAFRVPGRVAEMLVDEGDRIKAGETIARIDAAPFEAALAQAEGSLAAARAGEALLIAGSRAEDIARLQAQMDGHRAAVVNAQATFKRQQGLVTSAAASQQALDNARAALDRAKAEHEAARQAHIAAVNGARPEEIQQAAAQRHVAEAQRDAAQIQLRDTALAAPSNGMILTRAVEPGAMVAAGTSVITLSLDHPVWVRAYVQEPDLGRIATGTKVRVYTDSRPEHPYGGTVGFVSPRAEFTPKQVETQDLRTALVYRLRIVIEDADGLLRQGMPVTVRLSDKER